MKRFLIFTLTLTLCLLCSCSRDPAKCTHEPGTEPNCTEAQICLKCGTELQPALGHEELFEGCESGSACNRCGKELSAPAGHTPGAEATCTDPQICTVCDAVLAEATGHNPSGEATCTEDSVCTNCNMILEAAAHIPGPDPTCIDPQICTVCAETLTPAFGHEAEEVTAELAPTHCSRCGITMALYEGADPAEYIHETVTDVHYNNTLDAFYSGNVLVCGDYALEYFSMDEAGSADWAAAVNSFAQSYPDIHTSALLIPKSCAFNGVPGYEDKIENQLAFIDATYGQLNESITAVDAAALMQEHSGEYLYYRTDHHWTSLGAYYASAAYCTANGIVPRQLGSYETTIQTGYVGSLYSFSAEPQPSLKSNPDYTVCHFPKSSYSMIYQQVDGDPIPGEALNTETSSYAGAFICGDNALTHIETDNQTGRNLLIFKESYGNAFAPFMIDYYDNIVILDIRQSGFSTAAVIDQYGITDALVINNVQASTSLISNLSATLAS